MASLALILWSKERTDGTHTIAFRLTINRKSKPEMTAYHVRKDQFQPGLTDWVYNHPDAKRINRNLEIRRQQIANNLLDADAGMIPSTHAAIFGEGRGEGITIGALLDAKAATYEDARSKRAYRRALAMKRELIECWVRDMALTAITKKHVEQYVNWLKQPHISRHDAGTPRMTVNNRNTIKKKLQRLAGLVDSQKDEGLYSGANAFKLVQLPRQEIEKTKLSWEEIAAIRDLQLDGFIEAVRDMFLFAFYAHGMRFADCILFKREAAEAALKKANVKYKMGKNDTQMNIAATTPLHALMHKWLNRHTGLYMFPFASSEYEDKWELEDDKNSLNASVNTYLKRIAILAGIDKKVSFHVARHTFAHLMKKHQAAKGQSNIYTIQQALGHKDIKTTQMYLASLEDEAVNKEVAEMFASKGK